MKQPYAVAVVGMGGVFPSAPSVEAFWNNILAGHDASRTVGAERWPAKPERFAQRGTGPDGVASLKACLLDEIPTPKTALSQPLDDLSRLSLVAAEMTLEDARGELADRSRVATILASIALPTMESSRLSEEVFLETLAGSLQPKPEVPPPAVEPIWRQVTGRPAEAVANALGLGGYTLTLDAACASSLYAVKLACDALTDHRADAVLAGGANRADSLYTQAGFTALGAISATGQCSPFDRKGNGLVVGEGAGFLLLKRLDDALAQGDRIYAVIRGIGLSNDVGGSLLAPDSEGQLRALTEAYTQAGWTADMVGLVECHGTGTPMGDKTEFNSLRDFWRKAGKVQDGTVLGSVKSQIGHLLTGAGAAGLIKVIKAIESRTLPPMNNFESPSKGIDFEGTPFRILGRPEPWQGDGPLRAGVSAFGFGGINGHVLLEGPENAKASAAPSRKPEAKTEVVITAVGMSMGCDLDLDRFLTDRTLGRSAVGPRPEGRWPEHGGKTLESVQDVWGTYLQALEVEAGAFRVPPMDMPEILLQQSLMLDAAHKATAASSLGPKERCRRSGALIGINLDLETTNFHLRWALPRMLRKLGMEPAELSNEDRAALRASLSRPLDSTRTLGALGSIAASRAAREFSLGGPSYAISCGEESGVRAFEIALRAIENQEMDSCLVGAIDLAGDPRCVWAEDQQTPYLRGGAAKPFDREGRGTTVAEGAIALVLKSRAAAEADGDEILAVVESVQAASGAGALERSLDALAQSHASSRLGFVDVTSRARAEEDSHFLKLFGERLSDATGRPIAFGTVAGSLGQAGAVTGLLSVVSAATALARKVIPSVVGLEQPLPTPEGSFLPRESGFWWHDQADGPRRAASIGVSPGGDSHTVVLREASPAVSLPAPVRQALPAQLFLLSPTRIAELRTLAKSSSDLSELALRWSNSAPATGSDGPRGALVVATLTELQQGLDLLERCARGETPALDGQAGVFYAQEKIEGETAWVFPGSGNHYVGMGRELAVLFPEIAAQVSAEAETSYQHFTPWLTQPFGGDRQAGWEAQALQAISNDPLAPIFSQVTFAILASRILGQFLPQPQAAIGYSLGETAALFSMGAWKARDQMFQKTINSPLFTQQLRGEYQAARQTLGLSSEADFVWRVAVVNRPAEQVESALSQLGRPDVFLLIVNTANECVVGGSSEGVAALCTALSCEAFTLEGVPTVHCSVVVPVADAYRDLHRLPTTPPAGVRFYNGHRHAAYIPDTESAAESITENALFGFSFPALIQAAYDDGVRKFLEIGPGGSAARMIGSILEGQPHWSRSASSVRVGESVALLRALASAYVHGADLKLEAIYPQRKDVGNGKAARPKITVRAGSTLAHRTDKPIVRKPLPSAPAAIQSAPQPPRPENLRPAAAAPAVASQPAFPLTPAVVTPAARPAALPQVATKAASPTVTPEAVAPETAGAAAHATRARRALVWTAPETSRPKTLTKDGHVMSTPGTPSGELTPVIGLHPDFAGDPAARIAASIVESTRQTALAHESYLQLMNETRQRMESLLSGALGNTGALTSAAAPVELHTAVTTPWKKLDPTHPNPLMRGERPRDAQAWLNREACLEFAVGSVEKILGAQFAPVDRRAVRVRLPDEPLMLCDRMMSVEGTAGALSLPPSAGGTTPLSTQGRLITEHDVFPEAWYLDHDRAPVCISVEAGQADLFLCSYLGIDLVAASDRAYRLLDATISFHRGLPQPGETIVYDIRINRFVQQGEVYLFFFEFDGTINGEPLITMRNGCAGFHTYPEIEASGGIVLTRREKDPRPGKAPAGWSPSAPFPAGLGAVESYSDAQIAAFRRRDLVGCFGPDFAGLPLQRPYGLPEGRMKLFDRVTRLQANGGRFGLGQIEAEADIHPDDWFLTCHFPDDMVMPGTLMYECCAHTLRFLLARLGWLSEESRVAFEPRQNTPAALKCRGPVTVKTKHVV